jgi:hypothetical protein
MVIAMLTTIWPFWFFKPQERLADEMQSTKWRFLVGLTNRVGGTGGASPANGRFRALGYSRGLRFTVEPMYDARRIKRTVIKVSSK